MEYFIIENNGQQAGPFSLEQLVQKAITPETLVWAQGMKDWTPAWKIAELKTVLETVEAIKANTANKENAEGTSADAAGNNGTEAATFRLQTSRVSSRHSRKHTSKAFSTAQQ